MSKLLRAKKCIGKTYKGRMGWDKGLIVDVRGIDLSFYREIGKIKFNEYNSNNKVRKFKEWFSQYDFDSIDEDHKSTDKNKQLFFIIELYNPSTDGKNNKHAAVVKCRFEKYIED